jgi:hypothetical protein
MEALPARETAGLREALVWQTGRLEATNARGEPLCVRNAHRGPGLYRMTWREAETWARAQKERLARATPQIEDPRLNLEALLVPVTLTIGRSTNIYYRIRQHFGTNRNNNRVLLRLQELFPASPLDDVRDIARASLKIEWVPVASWVERCVLERYGCATQRAVLDIDAEH